MVAGVEHRGLPSGRSLGRRDCRAQQQVDSNSAGRDLAGRVRCEEWTTMRFSRW